MVELLVAIAVIALLVTMLFVGGNFAIQRQHVRNTENTMRTVRLAIDNFSQEDPLAAVYDRRGEPGFGPYPPYQLEGPAVNNTSVIRQVVEGPLDPMLRGQSNYKLENRLWRDLGKGKNSREDWVKLSDRPDQRANDDIRALYTYLKVFSPASVDLIDDRAISRLDPAGDPEFVNPQGKGTNRNQNNNDPGMVDVLGIHDAWGVPLDYMLYVKVEPKVVRTAAGAETQLRVVERIPVLRSRGVSREVYDSIRLGNGKKDPSKWIFSESLPKPWAVAPISGVFPGGQLDEVAGWLRAAADNENYKYLPDDDDR